VKKDCLRRMAEKVRIFRCSQAQLGTFIISQEPVAEQGLEGNEESIKILTVGFDQPKLEPIISALMT
jgi:hypothetical protein